MADINLTALTNELEHAAVAGEITAILSGAPSTIYALARGRDPLEGALAAGTLLLPRARRHALLLRAATIVHLALSIGWALVLARTLPQIADHLAYISSSPVTWHRQARRRLARACARQQVGARSLQVRHQSVDDDRHGDRREQERP